MRAPRRHRWGWDVFLLSAPIIVTGRSGAHNRQKGRTKHRYATGLQKNCPSREMQLETR